MTKSTKTYYIKKIACTFSLLCLIQLCIFAAPNNKASDDTSGFWNETDIEIVCDDIISQVIESSSISRFSKEKNRPAVVVVGKIRNESSERIDTKLVARKFQEAIQESGVLDFTSDRNDRNSDEANANEEKLADFMLNGNVKSMVTKAKKEQQRTYYVTIQLVDIHSSEIVFSGESQVSKNFKAPKSSY